MSPNETGDIHANRGPEATWQAVLHMARSRYPGFDDHHLCEKLNEQEGLSVSRETRRRADLGSPTKRPPPRAAREGELVQLDGSRHDWPEGRGPSLTALGTQDDATGKILIAQFFLSETAEGYFGLLQNLLRRFTRRMRSKNSELA